MKKLAIGCFVVVVLLAIAAAVGSFYIYRQVRGTVAQFSELSSVPELEGGVRNKQSFTPPLTGELTEPQVERLVRVQGRVRERLGAGFTQLEAKYKDFFDQKDVTALDTPKLIAAYRDLAAVYMEGKRAQIDALNDAGLSLEEYRWVRSQAYAAVGIPIVDLDVSKLVSSISSGQPAEEIPGRIEGSIGPSGPEQNQKLVEPIKKQLESNAALASFGL